MTLELLNKICEKYDIPKNVTFLSDSGWECGPTEMDGIYYNREKNLIVFTQEISKYEAYDARCYHHSWGDDDIPESFKGFIPCSYDSPIENPNPCLKCDPQTRASCCGCPEWDKWHTKKEVGDD